MVYKDLTSKGLEAASNLSLETGHPGNGIRPCIATLLESPLSKGEFPNRNTAALVIATEFYRIGQNFDQAMLRLEHWNQYNNPPLKQNELQKAVRNAFGKEYNYSCQNTTLQTFCVGDICPFIKHVKSHRKKVQNYIFIDYGWQKYLSHLQVLIYYLALPYLEIKRRVGPGGLIFANHKQIAETCGVSNRRIGENLKILQITGLIEYKPGLPQKWMGLASEIRRIIPIPRPTNSIIKKLKEKKK